MAGRVVATKADIVAGLKLGLVFVQSSHAPSQERVWVDELISEGEAYGFWAFRAAGGTEMIRLVRKTGDRRKREPLKHVLDPLRAPLCSLRGGHWIRERQIKPYWFLLSLLAYGIKPFWIGWMLEKMARAKGQFPKPLTPEFLHELAINISIDGKTYKFDSRWYRKAAHNSIEQAIELIYKQRYNHILHHLLAWHGIAPLPSIDGDNHWSTYLRN